MRSEVSVQLFVQGVHIGIPVLAGEEMPMRAKVVTGGAVVKLISGEGESVGSDEPFFSLKLRYEGDHLAEAALNGRPLKEES